MTKELTKDNWVVWAAKHYNNVCIDDGEFIDDIKRFKYIKRLLNRYIKTGDLKERLILNHLIILNNVFGPHATVKLVFLLLEDYLSYICPFLNLIGILPEKVVVGEKVFYRHNIEHDEKIVNILKNITRQGS